MSFALSLAWRMLLALALVVSPMVGMACGGGGPHGATAQVAKARDAMPGCTRMAGMAAKAPHGKPDATRAHAGCSSNACCLGGPVAMTGTGLVLAAQPPHRPHAAFPGAPAPTPPSSRVLRPPIA